MESLERDLLPNTQISKFVYEAGLIEITRDFLRVVSLLLSQQTTT